MAASFATASIRSAGSSAEPPRVRRSRVVDLLAIPQHREEAGEGRDQAEQVPHPEPETGSLHGRSRSNPRNIGGERHSMTSVDGRASPIDSAWKLLAADPAHRKPCKR